MIVFVLVHAVVDRPSSSPEHVHDLQHAAQAVQVVVSQGGV